MKKMLKILSIGLAFACFSAPVMAQDAVAPVAPVTPKVPTASQLALTIAKDKAGVVADANPNAMRNICNAGCNAMVCARPVGAAVCKKICSKNKDVLKNCMVQAGGEAAFDKLNSSDSHIAKLAKEDPVFCANVCNRYSCKIGPMKSLCTATCKPDQVKNCKAA